MLSLSVVQLVFRAGERLSSGSLIAETLNSDALLASLLNWAEDSSFFTLFSFYFAIRYFSQAALQMCIHRHEGHCVFWNLLRQRCTHWADLSTCWKYRRVKRGILPFVWDGEPEDEFRSAAVSPAQSAGTSVFWFSSLCTVHRQPHRAYGSSTMGVTGTFRFRKHTLFWKSNSSLAFLTPFTVQL